MERTIFVDRRPASGVDEEVSLKGARNHQFIVLYESLSTRFRVPTIPGSSSTVPSTSPTNFRIDGTCWGGPTVLNGRACALFPQPGDEFDMLRRVQSTLQHGHQPVEIVIEECGRIEPQTRKDRAAQATVRPDREGLVSVFA